MDDDSCPAFNISEIAEDGATVRSGRRMTVLASAQGGVRTEEPPPGRRHGRAGLPLLLPVVSAAIIAIASPRRCGKGRWNRARGLRYARRVTREIRARLGSARARSRVSPGSRMPVVFCDGGRWPDSAPEPLCVRDVRLRGLHRRRSLRGAHFSWQRLSASGSMGA